MWEDQGEGSAVLLAAISVWRVLFTIVVLFLYFQHTVSISPFLHYRDKIYIITNRLVAVLESSPRVSTVELNRDRPNIMFLNCWRPK